MKRILTTAVIAVIFTLTLGLTAHAEPTPAPAQDVPADPNTPTGIEAPTDAAGNPFTPAGSGTVTDYATGGDGKEFYTITATDDMVFYLVIDRQKSAENVYFLNAVTVDDLLSLAAQPESKPGAAVVTPPTPAPDESKPAETPTPQGQGGGNNAGMWIFIAAFAVIGGGAAWYFKIYRPKQQGASEPEYEPPIDGDEPAFDDWDDPSLANETDEQDGADGDAPPWDEESGAADE